MAVTEITPTQMSLDTAITITAGAGTAIVAANTMEFAYPKHGKLLIIIDSDHADTAATFTASDYGINAGLGSLEVAVGNGLMKAVIVDSARLNQSVGSGANTLPNVLEVSWAANSAGFVRAFYLP
jgi:uncharacterized protein with LGFP repeats